MDEQKQKPQDGALFIGSARTEDPAKFAGDGKAEESAEIVDELMGLMGLDVDVAIREDAERVILDVTGPDAGRVIGKKGQTLDSIQFLVNKIVNRLPEARRHVIVDSGDYRDRHDNGLMTMAHREAKRALSQDRVITLQPMSARDRRVIHLSLAKFDGVITESEGQGKRRRIRIIPAHD